MRVRLHRRGLVRLAVLLAWTVIAPLAARLRADAGAALGDRPVGRWQDASLADYRKHLVALEALTTACAKARDVKTCDPLLVGPDDRVPLGAGASSERRIVRYGWLRILFSRAEGPDQAEQAPDVRSASRTPRDSAEASPTTSQLLVDAQVRLAHDLALATGVSVSGADHPRERDIMRQVLGGREFRNLQQPTERDTVMEKVNNWLNRLLAKADKLRSRSRWVGRALVLGLIAAIGVGLAWALIQMERRWRIRLVPLSDAPARDAASARDWQLWMADARKAADFGQWREAIHFLYWASISRLESKRLWPADRARTPREYLALVAPGDPRRAGLASLTGSFERTWYGGRNAGESEYLRAEALARGLISGSGVAVQAEGGAG